MQKEQSMSILVDFLAERHSKQRHYDGLCQKLLNDLREHGCQTLNLREKVRAKHLFRNRIQLSSEALLLPFWEAQYGMWFLLEYQNIKGERIIEKYLLEHHPKLSEEELHLAAYWMAAYPSVYKVEEEWKEGYRLVDLWSEQTIDVTLKRDEFVRREFIVGQYLFARVVKVGFIHCFLGPYALLNKEKIVDIKKSMEESFYQSKEENSQWSWRLFMQHHGIEVLREFQ
ncbi:hypothetical protein [Aneurinibacillus terranovensis]|uniref:hypothetical protein n=1 Tax=Aneurinibacillus terranovensis TaxID=278991 RepID=UPI00041EBE58|nr:hypothetical protein [Aneurinibacillus terranovensis]